MVRHSWDVLNVISGHIYETLSNTETGLCRFEVEAKTGNKSELLVILQSEIVKLKKASPSLHI